LKALIEVAYDLPSNRVLGGPAWLSSDRFDINAKPEGSINVSTQDGVAQLRLMLQAMLAERFKVDVHWETKEVPVYALMVDKNGPKMKAVPGGNGEGSATAGRGTLSGLAPMVRLARELSNFLGRPVLDQTGLQGRFEFKLEWTPDQSPARTAVAGAGSDAGLSNDDLGASLFTAIQEQLGLRLQSQRGSASVLIVDRAEKVIYL